MNKQWHRDRIDELKFQSSNLKWKLASLLTGLLGFVSLIYLVWYNSSTWLVKMPLVVVFVFVLTKISGAIKGDIKRLNSIVQKVKNNYDVLLKRG